MNGLDLARVQLHRIWTYLLGHDSGERRLVLPPTRFTVISGQDFLSLRE